jgi:hypothetical protein
VFLSGIWDKVYRTLLDSSNSYTVRTYISYRVI